MESKKIFTEEPEEDLWRSLLQYSYKANIKRYFDEHEIKYLKTANGNADEELVELETLSNCISGALLQANEYYKASKIVSLQVAPLLLYYGTTNLLFAMSVLMSGKIPTIKNHGMHIYPKKEDKFIADTEIQFDHPKDGGVHIFAISLGYDKHLYEYRPWTIRDFLDSIAEISNDFSSCYSDTKSHALLVDVVKLPNSTAEKLYIDNEHLEEAINNIEGFSESYLTPQSGRSKGELYFVLHHKLNSTTITNISYSGQPYLQVGHIKSGKLITVPRELNMYIILFALSSLCRYHPEIWNPFVTKDSTGEKLLIEKTLYYSRRLLPNAVLNRILGINISFVSNKYVEDNRVHFVGKHEVCEIVDAEVENQLRSIIAEQTLKLKG